LKIPKGQSESVYRRTYNTNIEFGDETSIERLYARFDFH